MRENFIYINTNLVRNMVVTKGIDASDFVNGIKFLPDNAILLNDDRSNANGYNAHTQFSTISGSNAVRDYLLDKQIQNKRLIDFHDEDDLDILLDREISDLLFLGHMTYPMASPFYSKLQNRYIYMNLDANFVKMFFRQFSDFNNVLDLSLKRHLRATHNSLRMFSRPLVINDIPETILKKLIMLSSDGLIIAFDKEVEQRRLYQIPLMTVNNADQHNSWYTQGNIYQNATEVGKLTYQINGSKWEIEITSQPILDDMI